ncbi:Nuclear receptor domain-containing protein [Aphelenchoides besseyi]|nr:Nuclear receptor domain-containing protein [Aphelenchoides besseyi]KAI6193239.1 Nuclear receptor domain-containing protein [Aphelenchoides besseyi]
MIPGIKLEPTTPCSPSTSVSSSGAELSCVGKCPICCDAAWSKHFNVLCCNACAAFFRRTVAAQKSYFCVRGKNCTVKAAGRMICKFCRFKRCVWSGMSITVAMLRVPADKRAAQLNKPPLQRLITQRKATFVNRFQATINVYGGRCDSVDIGRKMPTFTDIICALHAEFTVLLEYLHSSGFIELGLNHVDLFELASDVFYLWVAFNTVTSTARSGGYATNFVYFVDESHWPVKEEMMDWFHETNTELRDPQVASRSAFQLSKSVVGAATTIHYARFDEGENATMCQMLLLKAAIRLFPSNPNLPVAMNCLFENLKVEYEQNFDDFAIRLANLILLSNQIETITHQFNEYIVLLTLSGYETVLSKIIRAERKVQEAADLGSEVKLEPEYSP